MHQRVKASEEEAKRLLRCNVLAITRLRMSGQIDEMMRYFAPDVVVRYHCTKEGLFLPGVVRGRAAFKENIRLTDVEYEPLGSEILEILVEKDMAAVRWRNSWRHRGAQRVITLDMAHFLRWRKTVVVEVFEYLDYHGWGKEAAEARLDRDEPRPS